MQEIGVEEMSFVRPEIMHLMHRWREALTGLAFLGLAVWLVSHGFGARLWAGVLVGVFGLGLVVTGIPRARTRTGGEGAGVVEVDERRITYFGPLSGGAMALEDIEKIAATPENRWVLTSSSGERMTIPMNASGSDALFDAFSALPGISVNMLADAVREDLPSDRPIWMRARTSIG